MTPENTVLPAPPDERDSLSPPLKPWKHPQSWVPRELSYYFFMAPFFFWPAAIVLLILAVYGQDLDGVKLTDLRNYEPPTVSFVFAADGTPMAELYEEHRLVVPLDYIPPKVIEAFLSAEDNSFFQHQGVDLFSIGRAALANYRAGKTVQGASTITQQMIRTFLLSNERTMDRKLKEMILAWRVERLLSKEEILHLYLNRIFLGRGAYGVESAARLYYGKSIRDVNLAEASMLAGLVKAPGKLRAHEGSEASRERQGYVLNRMYVEGYVTLDEAREALVTPLEFPKRPNLFREVSPHFSEVIRQQMIQAFGAEATLNNGYRIHTTLDLKAQAMAEEAVRNGLNNLAKRQRMSPVIGHLNDAQIAYRLENGRKSLADRPLRPNQEPAGIVTELRLDKDNPGVFLAIGDEVGFLPHANLKWHLGNRKMADVYKPGDLVMVRAIAKDPTNGVWLLDTAPPPDIQGALVIIENATGKVLAMVGGRDFGITGVGNTDFNRATLGLRQPGSSFKPFVYAAALDNGYTEASVVWDVPMVYPDGPGKTWMPKNYGGKHSGPLTLLDAIKRSVNIVAVKVIDSIGPETVVDYARKMGISSNLNPTLSLALGASEVTLLDLTKAYTTFPNLGSWVWPTFIERVEDRRGNPVLVPEPYFTEAISPQTAYIMIDMLSAVATSGTAAKVKAALKVPVAGKTGTTNDQADALFVGFTPEYTCGVWVGRDSGRKSLGGGEQGGRTAAPIFIEFMTGFLADKETGKFRVPEGVVRSKLLDPDGYDEYLGKSASFVFKKGEVGPGRTDFEMGEYYTASEGPRDQSASSQEEIDRRL
ncbi:MAG: PBP1A family penicillin-binding protein, partial [Deltaproteobacteria bacterium]|nr:PBP1A family penicillin-binding protein [Deltaproteobacteria bacterium]